MHQPPIRHCVQRSIFFLHRTIISMCFIDHVRKVRLAFVILTRWDRVTHICVSKLTIFVSDNGLSPGRRQAIIWTNDGILLTEPLGTKFSETLIGIQTFSFKKMHLKMSSAKWRPFCLGLKELTLTHQEISKLRWLTSMPSGSRPSKDFWTLSSNYIFHRKSRWCHSLF